MTYGANTIDWDISMFRDGFSPLRARTAPARLTALAMTAALIVTVAEPLPAASAPLTVTAPLMKPTDGSPPARTNASVFGSSWGTMAGVAAMCRF